MHSKAPSAAPTDGGGRCRGVDETARSINQVLTADPAARDKSARAAQRLAQGSHQKIRLRLATHFRTNPGTLPEDTDGVGFVQQQEGAVTILELDQFPERCSVTIHAEHAFGDDQHAGPGLSAQ
jgi:hypothetical protein